MTTSKTTAVKPTKLTGIPAQNVGTTVQQIVNTTSLNIKRIECEKNSNDGTWTITADPS